MTVKKNLSNLKGQELWRAAENAASTVRAWPEWKRGQATAATIVKSNPGGENVGGSATKGSSKDS